MVLQAGPEDAVLQQRCRLSNPTRSSRALERRTFPAAFPPQASDMVSKARVRNMLAILTCQRRFLFIVKKARGFGSRRRGLRLGYGREGNQLGRHSIGCCLSVFFHLSKAAVRSQPSEWWEITRKSNAVTQGKKKE